MISAGQKDRKVYKEVNGGRDTDPEELSKYRSVG